MCVCEIKKAFITVYDWSKSKNGILDHKTSWRKKYLKQKGVIFILRDLGGQYFKWFPIDENNIVNYKKGMISSNDDYFVNGKELVITTLNSFYCFSIIEEIDLSKLPPLVT